MRRLFLGFVLATAIALLASVSASAAEYDTFVGCDDLTENPVPSHVCQVGDFPGAYFASDVDTEYDVCVEFPSGTTLCAEEQFAEAETLYVNSITSEAEGNHFVSWYVEDVEVGSWSFRLDPPPLPPADPPLPAPQVLPPPPPPPLPAAPLKSQGCLKAEGRVAQLKNRLRNTSGGKQKAKIRGKLRNARVEARRAC
ncbi:MAG TPA: hypothetical protein VFI03_09335 [Solirubrobacterales bacterium]|nr:hypothetical protein [Solirubrobacterales bacterium]